MGKKAWKTRVQSCKANNRAPPSVRSGYIIAFTASSSFLHPLAPTFLSFLSLHPHCGNVRRKDVRRFVKSRRGGKLEEFGVIPISNRWIVASFSRLNDTRFGGIETGLYLELGCKFWNLGMV